jgi:hypothetical protein
VTFEEDPTMTAQNADPQDNDQVPPTTPADVDIEDADADLDGDDATDETDGAVKPGGSAGGSDEPL